MDRTATFRNRPALIAVLSILALAAPAPAVLLDEGDGTQNTSAPPNFPHWGYVAQRGGLSAVYVGNGWVLTARHVPTGTIWIDGVAYPQDPAAAVHFENPDLTVPDLRAYRILPPFPPYPPLPIAMSTPAVNTEYIAIGRGWDRGDPTSWDPPTGPVINGYTWAGAKSMRWGTNLIDETGAMVTIDNIVTSSIVADFTPIGDAGSTSDEGIVVSGDSGGGMFVQENGDWVLAGILFARSSFTGQPATTSLYGNETLSVDLASYRDQIIPLVRPECSDEVDNDGDLAIDFPDDPECASAEDLSEGFDCADGFDNDFDGEIDHPSDPGCFDNTSPIEDPQCDDGIDNDADGGIDWDGAGLGPADVHCGAAYKKSEKSNQASGCGLGPGLLGLLILARRRRR